ncbi:MAG TPA: GrpB family protein [Gaiellaceae bacterium]|nr:GrpB family protein [Gaiellaceae bacterium]
MTNARVAVLPYDPDWPQRFEAERARLEPVLGPWVTDGIQHVGSTAIPGIAAKPIIDIVAGIRDLEESRAAFEPLRKLSYVYTPHRPDIAHHFTKPSPQTAQYGLHLTEAGSDLWRERLAFRNALLNDASLAAEYERLTLKLAEEHADDLAAYTGGKQAFVARVLAGVGEMALESRSGAQAL